MINQLDLSTLDLQDALDLAVLMEQQAEARYLMFAAKLGERYRGDAVDFFNMMARNERRHGAELAEQRRSLFGNAISRVPVDMVEEIEAPGMGKPRPYMSPRHALEVALESEIRAYEFFDQALPSIQDEAVRKLFEQLRNEEGVHQSLLKELMPKYPDTLEPDLDPEDIDTPSL